MDRRTFIKGFEIPPGSYGIFMVISFALFLVLYDLVIVPLVSWTLNKPFRLGVMVRMGVGIAISVLCISTLATVEYVRRKGAVSVQIRIFVQFFFFFFFNIKFLRFPVLNNINENKTSLIREGGCYVFN